MDIPQDTRYWDATYLNFSTLASAIEYDLYGTRKFNPLSVYHKIKQTDAMEIGTICDNHFTEGINFYETYVAVARRSKDGVNELTQSMYDACDSIIQSVEKLPGLKEELDMCTAQDTLSDNTLKIKGKLDFYDPEKNHIIDMKCTGNIDIFLRELYKHSDISPYHRYVRQLAWYSYLVEVNYGVYPTAELLAFSHSGEAIRITIPEVSRRIAFGMLLADIDLLRNNTLMQYQVTPLSEQVVSDDDDDIWS